MDTYKKLITDYDGKTGGISFSLLVIINILLTFVGQLILRACGVASWSEVYIAVGASFSIISIILVIALVAKTSKKGLLKITRVKKFDGYFILPAILLAFGMFFCFGFLNQSISVALSRAGLNVSTFNPHLTKVGTFILYLVTLGILPSFFEEIFFRGVLVSAGRKSNWLALSLTVGAMFALYHSNFAQLAYQFIYGVFLTLLAIKSKSVIPSIIAHTLNNVGIVVLEYLTDTRVASLNFTAPLVIGAGAVLLVAFLLFTFLIDRTKTERKEKCKYMWIFGAFGAFLCALMAILSLFVK